MLFFQSVFGAFFSKAPKTLWEKKLFFQSVIGYGLKLFFQSVFGALLVLFLSLDRPPARPPPARPPARSPLAARRPLTARSPLAARRSPVWCFGSRRVLVLLFPKHFWCFIGAFLVLFWCLCPSHYLFARRRSATFGKVFLVYGSLLMLLAL